MDRDPVGGAEFILKSLVYVADTDLPEEISTVLLVGAEDLRRLFLGHAHAVICHINADDGRGCICLPQGMDGDVPRALWFNAVKNGIFHQGLQGELQDGAVIDVGFFHLDVHGNGAAVAVTLYGKIVLQQGKFLPDGHQKAGSLGDALHQLGQGSGHLADAVCPLYAGHPLDGIQGIVDKVGVYLALEHLIFQFLFLFLLLQHPVHQQDDIL